MPGPQISLTWNGDNVMNTINDKSSRIEQHYYLPNEPLELTCAFEMSDYLDLDIYKIEWWQLDNERNSEFSTFNKNLLDQSDQDNQRNQNKPFNLLENKQKHLIWSSSLSEKERKQNNNSSNHHQNQNQNHRTKLGEGEFAIIDYVTRANKTNPNKEQLKIPAEDAEMMVELNDERESGSYLGKLIRVSHLLSERAVKLPLVTIGSGQQEGKPVERNFLCRITSDDGKEASLLQSIYIDSNNYKAQLEAKRRQAARKRLLESVSAGSHQANSLFAATLKQASGFYGRLDLSSSSKNIITSGGFEDAKRILEKEEKEGENQDSRQREEEKLGGQVLFLPLSLPQSFHLLIEESRSNQQKTPTSRGHGNYSSLFDHQKPATRNATGSSDLGGQARNYQQQQQQQMVVETDLNGSVSDQTRYSKRLHSTALALITRYTSNKASLINLAAIAADNKDDEFINQIDSLEEEEEVSDINSTRIVTPVQVIWPPPREPRSFVTRVKQYSKHFYSKHLDKWVQLAIGRASLLLGICAGLLFGFLLSLLILIRLKFGVQDGDDSHRGYRVADSSISKKDSKLEIHSSSSSLTSTSPNLNSLPSGGIGKPKSKLNLPNESIQDVESNMGAGSSSSNRTEGSEQKLIPLKRARNKQLLNVTRLDDSSNQASCEDEDEEEEEGEEGEQEEDMDVSGITLELSERDFCLTNSILPEQKLFLVSSPEQLNLQELSVISPANSNQYYQQLYGTPYNTTYQWQQSANQQAGCLQRLVNQQTNKILPSGYQCPVQSSCGEDQLTATTLDQDSSSSLLVLNSGPHSLQANQLNQYSTQINKTRPIPAMKHRLIGDHSTTITNNTQQNNSSLSSSYGAYSPAASTSGSSFTAAPNINRSCLLDSSQQKKEFQNEAGNIIYLDDALQLLNVSMNNCLQFNDDCDNQH